MKKILISLLALSIILSSFVACSKSDNADDTKGETTKSTEIQSNGSEDSDESSGEESTKEVIGNLDPTIDLSEKEYTIVSRAHPWFNNEVSVEDNDGDPINNAIFKRKLDVELKLNCKLTNYKVVENKENGYDFSVVNSIKNTLGPDCPYEIMSTSAFTAFGNTTSGICQNLLNIGNIDLSQDYWMPDFNEEATLGGRQYFATGAISLSVRRFVFVTFFNKRLAQEFNLDNLYDVVRNNEWTLEYQATAIQNMFTELDGEEGATEGDFFGFVTNNHICVDPYWTSGEADVLIKDENDMLVLSPDVQRLDAILEKVKDIYYGGNSYIFPGESGDVDQDKIRRKFTNGEATMATLRLLEVESEEFRNMSDGYGILPMPKFDKSQEKYYSHAHDQFCVYGVIGSVSELDKDDVGAILECMAIEGKKTVSPAYYEVALKGKYSKDPESWEMLDTIVGNIKINCGLLYTPKLNDFVQNLRNVVSSRDSSFANNVFSPRMQQALNRRLKLFLKEIEEFQA